MGDSGRGIQFGTTNHDPTVIGVAVACIVSVVIDEDEWDLYDSLVGVTLVFVLLAYGRFRRQTVDTRTEAVAVGAVWAFSLLLIFGFVIDGLQGIIGWPPFGARHEFDGFWFCVVWLVLTIGLATLLHTAGEKLLHPRFRPAASPDTALDPDCRGGG